MALEVDQNPSQQTCLAGQPALLANPPCMADVGQPTRPPSALQAEVSQLRNANSDSVADSEERLRQLQGDYEDLQRWVKLCCANYAN